MPKNFEDCGHNTVPDIHRQIKEEKDQILESIFNCVTDFITVVDSERRIIMCNPAVKDVFGYEPNEVIGKSARMLHLSQKGFEIFGKNYEGLVKQNKPFATTFRMKKKDGAIFDAEFKISTNSDEKNPVKSYVVVVSDVTAKKKEEWKIKGKIQRFSTLPGKVYCTHQSSKAIEAFKELVNLGIKGLLLSRKDYLSSVEFMHFRLGIKDGLLHPKSIESEIEKLYHGKVILLESMDFLYNTLGLAGLQSLMETLKDFAYLYGHIIIVATEGMPSEASKLLENELSPLNLAQDHLRDEYKDILRFIDAESATDHTVNYSDIADTFRFSRPTCRKKVKELIMGGYLLQKSEGRQKKLHLTAKGRNLTT